ncbi:MAG: CotH kinase family protein [Candidatus Kapaibacterium sp.]
MIRLLTILLLSSYISYGQLQINEICSDNDELLRSADGEYYDWIELYNNSNNTIELSNYYLSDDKKTLDKWKFVPQELPINGYIIVFASGIGLLTQGEQHSNFKLSSSGETLYLTDGTNIIDRVEFGAINEDYSFGRLEEDSELLTNLARPTPGRSNRGSGTIIADKESGIYNSEFILNLKAAEGQKIYYTTNGDDPTIDSRLYEGGIEIKDEYEEYEYLNVPTTTLDSLKCGLEWEKPTQRILRSHVISFCTIDSNNRASKVNRKSYFLGNNHQLPVVSISVDNESLFSRDSGIYVPGNKLDSNYACWSGNYYQKDWERSATITYFEDGRKLFEENAGIRIHGGSTRALPQKSIKFYARKKYGINKFDNVFFPQTGMKKFNSLLIRTTMAGWNGTLFKDALTQEYVKNLNLDKTYVKPVVVYINGNYWGISELRNRLDEDYFAEKYKIDQDSINIVHVDSPDFPRNGSYDDFAPVYEFIVNNDLSLSNNYQYIESRIDIDNLIDYYIAEMYFNNFDWPGNNFMIWNSMELDKKYRALFYDLDGGWFKPDYDMFEHTAQLEHSNWPNPKNINIVLQKLLSNEQYKLKFIERILYLLDNEFKFEKLEPLIAEQISKYESEIENNIIRFGFPENKEKWLSDINYYLTRFASERECYFKEHLVKHFNLDDSLLCSQSSIAENSIAEFTLSPNPATNSITVKNISTDYISIFDLNGTELLKVDTKFRTKLNIDISFLEPSVYFIKMQNRVLKFVKIK